MSKYIFLTMMASLLTGAQLVQAQFLEAPQYSTQSPAEKGPSSVAVGNFEGDAAGHQDLAVVDGTGTVSVFLNRRDGSGSFLPPSKYNIGTNASSYVIAAGKFQSETQSAQDLVVADSSGNVTVLLNNDSGSGGFQAAKLVLSAAANFTSLVTGDLHDKKATGLTDVAVVNATSGAIVVLASQGSGDFAQPASFASNVVAGQSMFLLTSNLVSPLPARNDLAVAAADGSVAVLANQTKSGPISFAAGVVVSPSGTQGGIPAGITSIAAVEEASVNNGGTGVADLVVASTGTGSSQGLTSPVPSVWYLLDLTPSQGALYFFLYQNYFQPTAQVGFDPVSLAASDIDGDGNVDLLIANQSDNSVSVVFGDGIGDLSSIPITGGPPVVALEFGSGLGPIALATGTFSNGSNQLVPDVAVADQLGDCVSVLLNQGLDQSSNWLEFYNTRSDWLTPAFPVSIAAGLVQTSQTENGLPDALVANQSNLSWESGNGPFSDFTNDGTGNFDSANTYGTNRGIATANALVSGDFNGDGYADVGLVDSAGLVSVFLDDVSQGISSGYDIPPSQLSLGTGATSYYLALGNFTPGHAQPDLVVADGRGFVTVVLNDGQGNIKFGSQIQASASFSSVLVADLNGDGLPDVVAGDSNTGLMWVFQGTGGGQLAPGFSVTTNLSAGSVFLAAGKFSSSGQTLPDLAVASQSGQVEVLVNTSSASSITFSQPVSVHTFSAGTTSLAAWDFNQDGLTDLVVGSTQVWLFFDVTPYGTPPAFATPVPYAVGNAPAAFAVADFNGDGSPDLAVANSTSPTLNPTTSSNTVSVLWNTGFFAKVTLTTSANPVQVGHTVVLTATAQGSKSIPTGQVTFYDGSTNLGASTLNNGVATLSISTLAVGVHYITAVYNGDSNYGPSVANILQQFVSQGVPQTTTTTLKSSVNPSIVGQSVVFTATVMPTSGQGSPTGTVQFLDGSTLLATSALSGGVATFSTSTLAQGSHSMSAAYSGDINFEQSASSPLMQQVNPAPPPTPDFGLTTSPSSTTLQAGSSASFTIKGLQVNGFAGAITLACNSSGLPSGASCQFFPGTLTINSDGTSGTSTLTVSTASGSFAAGTTPFSSGGSTILYAMAAPLVFGAITLSKPKRRRRVSACLMFLVLIGGCFLQTSCGGGSASSTQRTTGGTPPGSYSITVMGAAGSKHHTAVVTLIVQ